MFIFFWEYFALHRLRFFSSSPPKMQSAPLLLFFFFSCCGSCRSPLPLHVLYMLWLCITVTWLWADGGAGNAGRYLNWWNRDSGCKERRPDWKPVWFSCNQSLTSAKQRSTWVFAAMTSQENNVRVTKSLRLNQCQSVICINLSFEM